MKIEVKILLDTDTNKLSVDSSEVFSFDDYIHNEKNPVHDIPDSVTKKLLKHALMMYEGRGMMTETAQQIANKALEFESKERISFDRTEEELINAENALEQIANIPRLTIPREISELVDNEFKDCEDKLYTFNKCYEYMELPDKLLLHKNYLIISIYLAGKALGVELVEVVE